MKFCFPAAQADLNAELLLGVPDGFARLILHGLAQFHKLISTTRLVNGNKYVIVSKQPPSQQQAQQVQHVSVGSAAHPHANCAADQEASAINDSLANRSSNSSSTSTAAAASSPGLQPVTESNTSADRLMHHVAITCTDVVMALKELGGSFDQANLMRFMKTKVHGSTATSDDLRMS